MPPKCTFPLHPTYPPEFPYGYGSIPINTIFSGLFTSINPSYFDVNYTITIGFDTLPILIEIVDLHKH